MHVDVTDRIQKKQWIYLNERNAFEVAVFLRQVLKPRSSMKCLWVVQSKLVCRIQSSLQESKGGLLVPLGFFSSFVLILLCTSFKSSLFLQKFKAYLHECGSSCGCKFVRLLFCLGFVLCVSTVGGKVKSDVWLKIAPRPHLKDVMVSFVLSSQSHWVLQKCRLNVIQTACSTNITIKA